MAFEGYRVRIGEIEHYFPETDAKQSFAVVSLVEPKWTKDADDKWVEDEPVWHKGIFRGANADRIQTHEAGDSLLVLGRVNTYTRTGTDGKTYENVELNVNHFSPDVTDRAVRFVYDRDRRQSRGQQRESVAQSKDQEPSEGAEQDNGIEDEVREAPVKDAVPATPAVHEVTPRDTYVEMEARLDKLTRFGVIGLSQGQTLKDRLANITAVDKEEYCQAAEQITRESLPPEAAEYVGSAPRAMLRNEPPPSPEHAQQVAVAVKSREASMQASVQAQSMTAQM